MMRKAAVFLIASAGWSVALGAAPQTPPREAITVHLSSFAFTPDRLSLRAGTPVRLHLVNDSGKGHDFSAPALFAASAFPNGAPPAGGRIELGGKQSADIVFVPHMPGTYKVRCTHFLHSLFGMTGSVVVQEPTR